MQPQRPPGTINSTAPARPGTLSGSAQVSAYDVVRKRVYAKLADRMDMGASKRMPASLLRQSLRQQAEQFADQEGRGLAKPDRDRLISEVLAELLGFGPLDALFADPTVREVMVANPNLVLAKREQWEWEGTDVRFRDEKHVRATFDRIATHADPIGPVMGSMSLFDMRLPNNFRVIAVLPPESLGPATAVFIREATPTVKEAVITPRPAPPPKPPVAPVPIAATTRPSSSLTDSGSVQFGGMSDSSKPGERDPLAKHRNRILERLLAKFAALKVFDLTKIDVAELRKIIAVFIREYAEIEKIYLSEEEQGRLLLEVLTSLQC